MPIVLDTSLISSSGQKLLNDDAKRSFIDKLIPKVTLLTPNIPEIIEFVGYEIKNLEDMKRASLNIYKLGCSAILLKGGHLGGDAIDLLYDGESFTLFSKERINSNNTHETGCTLSSSITANLAKGLDLKGSVYLAKEFTFSAIKRGFFIGKVNHFKDEIDE